MHHISGILVILMIYIYIQYDSTVVPSTAGCDHGGSQSLGANTRCLWCSRAMVPRCWNWGDWHWMMFKEVSFIYMVSFIKEVAFKYEHLEPCRCLGMVFHMVQLVLDRSIHYKHQPELWLTHCRVSELEWSQFAAGFVAKFAHLSIKWIHIHQPFPVHLPPHVCCHYDIVGYRNPSGLYVLLLHWIFDLWLFQVPGSGVEGWADVHHTSLSARTSLSTGTCWFCSLIAI